MNEVNHHDDVITEKRVHNAGPSWGNPPTGDFHYNGPVMRNNVFFAVRNLHMQLNKQSQRWFETIWRSCDATVLNGNMVDIIVNIWSVDTIDRDFRAICELWYANLRYNTRHIIPICKVKFFPCIIDLKYILHVQHDIWFVDEYVQYVFECVRYKGLISYVKSIKYQKADHAILEIYVKN